MWCTQLLCFMLIYVLCPCASQKNHYDTLQSFEETNDEEVYYFPEDDFGSEEHFAGIHVKSELKASSSNSESDTQKPKSVERDSSLEVPNEKGEAEPGIVSDSNLSESYDDYLDEDQMDAEIGDENGILGKPAFDWGADLSNSESQESKIPFKKITRRPLIVAEPNVTKNEDDSLAFHSIEDIWPEPEPAPAPEHEPRLFADLPPLSSSKAPVPRTEPAIVDHTSPDDQNTHKSKHVKNETVPAIESEKKKEHSTGQPPISQLTPLFHNDAHNNSAPLCEGRFDLSIVLEASDTLSRQSLVDIANFVGNLSNPQVRVGFIAFNSEIDVLFSLDYNPSTSEMKQNILGVKTGKSSAAIGASAALDAILMMSKSESQAKGAPQILAMFSTTSLSQEVVLVHTVAHIANFNVLTVQIKPGLADSTVYEQEGHFSLRSFDELTPAFFDVLKSYLCKIPQVLDSDVLVRDKLRQEEFRYFTTKIPHSGRSVSFDVLQGSILGYYSFKGKPNYFEIGGTEKRNNIRISFGKSTCNLTAEFRIEGSSVHTIYTVKSSIGSALQHPEDEEELKQNVVYDRLHGAGKGFGYINKANIFSIIGPAVFGFLVRF